MRILIIAGLIFAVLAGALAFAWPHRIAIPGVIDRLRDPIGAPREIVWTGGADPRARSADERPPNIVVILVDDLGINDISAFGGGIAGGLLQTPNIDAIAANGAVFENGYSGNATCAPSRAAIMTGRFATRFGFEFTPAPVAFHRLLGSFDYSPREAIFHDDRLDQVIPLEDQGLPPSEITMAEMLQEQDYQTLFIGKWHLGAAEPFQPQNQGFDEWVGFYPGAALFLPVDDPDAVNLRQDFDPIDPFLWANLNYAVRWNGSERFPPQGYMTDYFADQAVAAIEANAERPFFMYLALNAPHTPIQAHRSDMEALSFIEDERLRVYAAMVLAVDRAVGRVREALEAQGIADNTIVVFSSDNGAPGYIGFPDLNAPYRGWKANFFEGGIRVPMLVEWPDRIAAGTRVSAPAAHVDLFATAAAASGAALPGDRVIDGVDLVALSQAESPAPRALFWRSGHYRVLLDDGWKLQVSEHPPQTWLFDLNTDPTEQTDLLTAEPARAAAMRAQLDAINAEQADPIWPSLVEPPIYVDKHLLQERLPEDIYVHWPN
ncbi:sulfatase-like hydrolase/transferase [Maricaulaceae bacterium MS644]